MSDLIFPTNGGQPANNDMRLFHRAVKERWPMTEEAKARWMQILDRNISEGDIRESNSALKVAVAMDAANQRDELASKYAIPVEDQERVRLTPSETVLLMDGTIPAAESTVEGLQNAKIVEAAKPADNVNAGQEGGGWPNPPLPSCLVSQRRCGGRGVGAYHLDVHAPRRAYTFLDSEHTFTD